MGSDKSQASQNLLGSFARLYWMLFGNLALFFTGAGIVRTEYVLLLSIFYFLILVSMIAVRYADVRFLGGQLADASGPASMSNWKRYSISIFILASAVFSAVVAYKKFMV